MKLNRKENAKRFASLDQQNVISNTQQSGALEHIRQRIEDTQQQIDTGNIILNQISTTLRFDWLRQLGSEPKGWMRRAIAMNVATYHAAISIQAALPSRLERILIEEPFILEDPIGRIAPVHLQFVTSWEAFHAVMESRFSNLQGFRKIQQRKYGLQDGATGKKIALTRPWQRAFLPGQRVEMAFIFQSDGAEDASATNTTCPSCQSLSQNTGDMDIHCQNCFIWYRRITEEQEVEHAPSVSGPVPPDRKRVTPDDLEGEEDVRDFKRVRLMRTKKRVSPYSNDEKISLRGGLSHNGRTIELVREKDGKIIPITTHFRRWRMISEEEVEEDRETMRSMARHREAQEPGGVLLKCRDCEKTLGRSCDLTKHEKCSEEKCKYFEFGRPTEKERDRHVFDKHSAAPAQYECLYPPCTYASKRESNCKMHMLKVHD